MREVLDAAAARQWAAGAVAALASARERIDGLNVYPVPDGDTGTNLYLTVAEGHQALAALDDAADLGTLSAAFARGSLLGARGNSGIITAQLLRGWADVLRDVAVADADVARRALQHADEAAWEAVAEPVEGTMLSVTRAAARAARDTNGGLAAVVEAAAGAARDALARTPDQLAVLRRSGVVDAGGAGVVVLLEALADVVAERPSVPAAVPAPVGAVPACEPGPDEEPHEVMYLLDAADDDVPALRSRLLELGSSVVVVGGGGLWNVHVHTSDPGAAVEAGIVAGRPHRVRVTHLGSRVPPAPPGPGPVPSAGLVAVAAGPGLAAAFQDAGAVVVLPDPRRRASTSEVLDAVKATGARAVVVLPNDPDTLAVAQAAAGVARDGGVHVTVLPTRAQVQGLAAAAVHDPGRDLAENVVAMSSAAGATRHGGVTVAAREAFTSAGRCLPGDVLGVVDRDFAVIGRNAEDVAVEVVRRLLSGGGELVTLVVGADGDEALAEAVTDRVRAERSDVEVHVLTGGQQRYPLLVGVE